MSSKSVNQILLSIVLFLLLFFAAIAWRIVNILPRQKHRDQKWRKAPAAARIVIVLGSGGHTHEMFCLLKDLDPSKYTHRTYLVSSGDAMSARRARQFEAELEERWKAMCNDGTGMEESKNKLDTDRSRGGHRRRGGGERRDNARKWPCLGPNHYDIVQIPRARRIHQPLWSTPLSCLSTLISSFPPLLRSSSSSSSSMAVRPDQVPATTPHEQAETDLPDLIIANGPATAMIIILASLILRCLNWKGAHSRAKCRTIYVESFARVRTLSLTGKLLLTLVDRFLVQWEELEGAGGRAEFCGVLV